MGMQVGVIVSACTCWTVAVSNILCKEPFRANGTHTHTQRLLKKAPEKCRKSPTNLKRDAVQRAWFSLPSHNQRAHLQRNVQFMVICCATLPWLPQLPPTCNLAPLQDDGGSLPSKVAHWWPRISN